MHNKIELRDNRFVRGLALMLVGLWVLLWTSAVFGDKAHDALKEDGVKKEGVAKVGEVELVLVAPVGFSRVDGISPLADKFIDSLKEKFKLRVLAAYANPEEWKDFAEGLARGQGRVIPKMALISVTTKMENKSYNDKKAKTELRRFSNMFALAVNTRPLAALFASQANGKLKEKLGYNLNFDYDTGNYTGKFNESDRTVSFGVEASAILYGQKTESYITTSALRVEDKFAFLAILDPNQSPASKDKLREASIIWLGQMLGQNTKRVVAEAE